MVDETERLIDVKGYASYLPELLRLKGSILQQMPEPRIVEAATVDGSDKLLKLTVDLGSEQRTVFAGIKAAYDPAQLKGRLTVVVANLAPRKMKFGLSEGMVLAASHADDKVDGGLYLLEPGAGALPGMRLN